MKRRIVMLALILWMGCAWASTCAAEGVPVTNTPAAKANTPGLKAAEALSTITGVAISPLFGVSAIGAWKFYKTAPDKRLNLPWFAQPWFWVPGLSLIALVFLKDVTGAAMPTAFKKPFDIAELFENKISALVAAGAFIPIVASIFGSCGGGDCGLPASWGVAFIDPARLLNLLVVPLAIVAFLIVWMVAHVVNVLILISPFGTVDMALKSARLFLLTTVAASSLANPYFGAAVAVVVMVFAWFVAGWSMRLLVFGNVFAWDLLTLRCKRFVPDHKGSRAFTAQRIDKVPVRTCGKMRRDAQGRLVLDYHRWLILPRRTLILPEGDYSVGRGLLNPEVLHLKDGKAKTLLTLPPRFVTHEEEMARLYQMAGVLDVGMIKGLKAIWNCIKGLLAPQRRAGFVAA
ncbi:MAG: hypothetical protein QOF48_2559 [Verrucomicrobiota bacterium]|jgi:hypothetical protein